jgi:hypothetical protein
LQTQSQKAMETNIERVRKLNEQVADLQTQLKISNSKRSVMPVEIVDLNHKIKVRSCRLFCSLYAYCSSSVGRYRGHAAAHRPRAQGA